MGFLSHAVHSVGKAAHHVGRVLGHVAHKVGHEAKVIGHTTKKAINKTAHYVAKQANHVAPRIEGGIHNMANWAANEVDKGLSGTLKIGDNISQGTGLILIGGAAAAALYIGSTLASKA